MNSEEEISVKAAGRRGGMTTRDRYGSDFYRRIGKMGGERTRELYAELLKEFGRRGGRPRRPTLDEYMGEEAGEKKEALRSVRPASPPNP
jgi:general stress protein YciG